MTGEAGRVVTFGEAMVRLTPPGNERLERATSLDLTVGGAELNSAATLVCLDVPAMWVSRLPDVPLGALWRAAPVPPASICLIFSGHQRSAGRAGVYYLERPAIPVLGGLLRPRR